LSPCANRRRISFYQIFQPEGSAQNYAAMNYLVVRASTDALSIAAIRNVTRQVLPSVVEVKIDSMTQLIHQDLSRERMLVGVSTGFAILAMLLTALGLYGLLMRTVTLRTREIGIRVALGAQRRSILLSIGWNTIVQTALGLVAGTIISLLATRAVRQLLELQSGNNVSSLLLGAAALLVVAVFATAAPARRAASVDPMQALRSE